MNYIQYLKNGIRTIKIFHMQYNEKKYPRKLKYFPVHVFDHSIFSKALCVSCASRNNCLLNSSKADISCLSCFISEHSKIHEIIM